MATSCEADEEAETIVYTSLRPGNLDVSLFDEPDGEPCRQLFAIPADGSGPAVRLTHDKWEDALPYWGGAPVTQR